jgi:hypothetical protein
MLVVLTVVEVAVVEPAGMLVPPHATISTVAMLQSSRMNTILFIRIVTPFQKRAVINVSLLD